MRMSARANPPISPQFALPPAAPTRILDIQATFPAIWWQLVRYFSARSASFVIVSRTIQGWAYRNHSLKRQKNY